MRYHLSFIPTNEHMVDDFVFAYTSPFGVADSGKKGSSNDFPWSEEQYAMNTVMIADA